MNEDSPNGSLYGTLVKHDQSETKRDTAPEASVRQAASSVPARATLPPPMQNSAASDVPKPRTRSSAEATKDTAVQAKANKYKTAHKC
jgi:hypothetical protein